MFSNYSRRQHLIPPLSPTTPSHLWCLQRILAQNLSKIMTIVCTCAKGSLFCVIGKRSPLQARHSSIFIDIYYGGAQTSASCTGFSPKLRLLGISTVAGNQTVAKVTQNALQFLEAAGLDIGRHLSAQLGSSCEVCDITAMCRTCGLQQGYPAQTDGQP